MTESVDFDRRIDFIERKVLLVQDRIIKQREHASSIVKRLERQLRAQEEMKKEWIKKINLEMERMKTERNDALNAHRHTIEDLRIKYECERENKLRELKVLIQEAEREIRELQRKRDEAIMKTKAEETQIQTRYQGRLNEVLRDEQSAMRTGVVRQKRLLEAPNIYSMNVDKTNVVGMKKRNTTIRRLF